jgi:hypothetical protein
MAFYWERHPDGPFVTLIAVATTYLDPENYDLDSLKELAKREDDEEMRVFKRELREALQDPSKLPGDELSESVEHSDGSDEAFLRQLWQDLYGDEPVDPPIAVTPRAIPVLIPSAETLSPAASAAPEGEVVKSRPAGADLPASL